MMQFVREHVLSVRACCLIVALLAVAFASDSVAQDPAPRFKNITREAHIQFSHLKGNRGVATILEEAGPGVCIADYNGDGWPDIYFVGGGDLHGRSIPARNALYRNNGDGTFTDVTGAAGMFQPDGKNLSAAAVDYDNDGWPDLFVANDSMRAYLYHNEHDGTFKEVGLTSGMALTEEGTEMAAMCLSFGDYDNDGL